MNLDILEKEKYISASEAALRTGYAPDYVGQLCRLRRIPGELRGRSWYVDFASLIDHKQHRQLGRRRKETFPNQYKAPAEPSVRSFYVHQGYPFSYSQDARPLLPPLKKASTGELPKREVSLSHRFVILALSLVLVWGMGSLLTGSQSMGNNSLALVYSAAEDAFTGIDPFFLDHAGMEASDYFSLLVEAFSEYLKAF
jgi:hypothetical protein